MKIAKIKPVFIKADGSQLSQKRIFKINNESYFVDDKINPINIEFTEYESEIGKKICPYEIIEKEDDIEIKYSGLVELNPGESYAYIFLVEQGITFELIFWKGVEKIKNFMANKYELEYNISQVTKTIPINLNQLNTPDKANLILINCPNNIYIKQNGELFLSMDNILNNIHQTPNEKNFVISFQNENYDKFEYKQIKPLEELNFKEIYENNKLKVDDIFKKINHEIYDENNIGLDSIFYDLYNEDIEKIITKKFIYPRKLLESEIDKEEYIDFFYKVIYFCYLYKKRKSNNFEEIGNKLAKNYNSIKTDKRIKIYEKLLLLKAIYVFDYLENEENIKYYKIDDFPKQSPLFSAFEFLKNFINKLDYNSAFYYPLMCIDSGVFKFCYKRNKKYILTTYGLNMYDIVTIKNHLQNLIPNLIIFSDSIKEDDYSETIDGVGLVALNSKKFNTNYTECNANEIIRNHYTFILAKTLFHEIYGHIKSSYSKDANYFYSPVCFKDRFGKLRFLTNENTNNLFVYLDNFTEIELNSLVKNNCTGDSGYYLEFFFGTINNKTVLELIDNIEEKTNLGILLNVDLWHNISYLIKFIELRNEIVEKSIDQNMINLGHNINEQIFEMRKLLDKKNKEEDNDCDMIIIKEYKNEKRNGRSKKKLDKKFNFFEEIK